jgi:hypothetical protein
LIVVGHVWSKKRVEDLLVVRLLPNGAVDLRFGIEGKLVQDFGSTDDRPSSVFEMPSGDIVVIGSHQQGKGGETYEGYLARFDANGKKAPKVTFFDCIAKSREFVTRAIVDSDGFIVGGYAYSSDVEKDGVFVARVKSNGTLDRDFGDAGVTRVSSAELQGPAVAWELTTAKNGDILLGGSSGDVIEKYRGFVLRSSKTGAPVMTWGKQGVGWGARAAKWMSMVADEGDGITAVNRFDGSLTRLDEKGELDLAFGVDGVVRGQQDDEYEGGVLEDTGDIVVAGRKLLVRFGPTTSTTKP